MKRTTTHIQTAVAAAAFLLPALTACTVISREVRTSDEPIAFASFVPDVTKAVVENAEGMENAFAVWGYRTPTGGAAEVLTVFDGDKIYRDDNTAPWTYDIPRFWVEGHYYFYALHPFPDGTDISAPAAGAEVTASCIAGQGISIVLNSPKADIDLMTATATRKYPLGGDGAVAFTFEHLLSRVSFVATTGSDNIIVNNLTLSGIAFSGTYTSSGWNLDETSSISAVSGIAVSTSGTTDLLDMLLIPQTISAECILTLSYSADGQKVEKTLIIPASPEWVAGKSYVYTLMLHYTDATLTVSVEPWVVEDIAVQW